MSSTRREILLLTLPGFALLVASVFLLRGTGGGEDGGPVFVRFVAAGGEGGAGEDSAPAAVSGPRLANADLAGSEPVHATVGSAPEPVLPPLERFQLALLDEEGHPVRNARVRVSQLAGAVIATAEDVLQAQPLFEITSDERGELGFAREPGRVYEIEVLADGFARKRYRLLDPGHRSLRVLREGRIAGYVRDDATRAGLAGVEVELWHDGGRRARVLTAADGLFAFDGVTPTEAMLRVVSADHLRQIRYVRVESGAIDWQDFDLVPGRSLQVLVIDVDGISVAGLDVRLVELNSGLVVGERRSGADGRIVFSSLRAGRDYMLLAHDPRRGSGRTVLSVPYAGAGATAADDLQERLVLRRGWTLRGRVSMEGGLPVEGAQVLLESESRGAFATSRHRLTDVVTDAEGRFVAEGLLADVSYDALVVHPDFALQAVVTDADGAAGSTLDVVLRNGRRIDGRVQDENGQPVPHATVFVHVPGRNGQLGSDLVVETDELGRYVLDRFGPDVAIEIQACDPGRGLRSAPGGVSADGGVISVLRSSF